MTFTSFFILGGMSNTTMDGVQLTDSINVLNKNITLYVFGSIWIMGNIGSILTCIVFHRPQFRKSPCAIYFFAASCSQLLLYNFSLLNRILQYGFNEQTAQRNLWFCKMRFYFLYLLMANARYNIILASVDRYIASSRDALRRQWSSSKTAFRAIVGNALFWTIVYIQVIVFYEIANNSCQPRAGTSGVYFSIYITIDNGILPLILMLIFGLLTAKNVRRIGSRRVEPVARNAHAGGQPIRVKDISRKDRHLQKMLINQIIVSLFLNIPNPCFLLYETITGSTYKSVARLQIEAFVSNMTYIPLYLGFALTFSNFMISSTMFRREFFTIIQTRILRRLPVRLANNDPVTVRNGTENVVDHLSEKNR
ncbi:unnamed protein product [Adineta ricciae]|uniref:G-protein coupled receptors family 1 profile domain-containing protein n=1 Tax=Adineta ricciae TaxID=249248 RepID=A0A814C0W1_ADIRI|nr:unnamed protein product [Adineta ricciae]CAF0984757.1 unnamed protein product [Adineta ricciae]